MLNKIMKIAKHYGYDKQKYIAIEEMAELTKAILKRDREPDNIKRLKDYKEELADTYIMILQLLYFAGDSDEICKIADKKLDRQLKRIENE